MTIKNIKSWLNGLSKSTLPATTENISKAKDFVLAKWKERSVERGSSEPVDLSYSCKFCTLFVKQVFGGRIEGNFDHQYNVIDGEIVDLSSDSEDVRSHDDPYHHDKLFFGSKDHLESLSSCLPRVEKWVDLFIMQMCQDARIDCYADQIVERNTGPKSSSADSHQQQLLSEAIAADKGEGIEVEVDGHGQATS